MAAAAPPGNAGKDDEDGVVPRRMSRAELVKRWEAVFDVVGYEKAMELFMTLLLRDARAQQARKEQEEEERRARVFEPWHPPPPGSSAPPVTAPPRVDRTVVLGLRAPPHLLPRRPPKHEGDTSTLPPPSVPAAADRSASGIP